MKLLDTTFLIDYWAGTDDSKSYLEEQEESESFISTTINLKELAVGQALGDELNPFAIQTTFGWLDFRPFGIEAAFEAASLEAGLRQRPDVNQDRVNTVAGDLLIAAIAQVHDSPVVTRDRSDFDLFESVAVESY